MRRLDVLAVRRRLGRQAWSAPMAFGPDGAAFNERDSNGRIIVTCSTIPGTGDIEWVHASFSRQGEDPTYADLCQLHYGVWGEDGHAYQVFVPATKHINIHEHALHLWGKLDGSPALPDFGFAGSI